MRLTLHTDYALRVLIHVAIADGKLITISAIAESFDISKQHLMKVVSDLSQKGYLDTVRGRKGGIRLRRPPRDINIGQVVRATEEARCYRLSGSERLLPDRARLRVARRVARCDAGVSRCLGRIYTGRSDQAAESVVVVAAARSARGACPVTKVSDGGHEAVPSQNQFACWGGLLGYSVTVVHSSSRVKSSR